MRFVRTGKSGRIDPQPPQEISFKSPWREGGQGSWFLQHSSKALMLYKKWRLEQEVVQFCKWLQNNILCHPLI